MYDCLNMKMAAYPRLEAFKKSVYMYAVQIVDLVSKNSFYFFH